MKTVIEIFEEDTLKKIEGLESYEPFSLLQEGHSMLRVTNPFSGESETLTPEAEAVYSYIMGAQRLSSPDWDKIQTCLSWFRQRYPKEYMTLLD